VTHYTNQITEQENFDIPSNSQQLEYFHIQQPFANTYMPSYDAYNNFYYHHHQFYGYPNTTTQLPLSFQAMSLNPTQSPPSVQPQQQQPQQQQIPSPQQQKQPRKKHSLESTDSSSPQVADAGANLFVFHLPSDVDDTGLYTLFAQFGTIESIKVITDQESGESKGYGFVKYYSMSDAIRAVEAMNGYQVGRKHLKVSFKTAGTSPPQATTTDKKKKKKLKSEDEDDEEISVNNQNFPALKQPIRIISKPKNMPKKVTNAPKQPSSPNSSLTGGSVLLRGKKDQIVPNSQEKQN
jgi:RNA recognition motif-containing protein